MILTNQLKKYIRSLNQIKHRQNYNKFIAEGPKVCKEFLICKSFDIQYILVTKAYKDLHNAELADCSPHSIIVINEKELSQVSNLRNPNGILIVAEMEQRHLPAASSPWSLYLDTIQDPGNMGTMIRIADWYGLSAVQASPGSVDFYNPKVVQAASGAHNRVKLITTTPEELVSEKVTYGLVLGGLNISELRNETPGVIVVGNESKGINQALAERLDHKMMIPRRGGAESLNAAVACGIACQVLIGE